MVVPLKASEKELRFTRSAQAVPFWLASSVCMGVAVTLTATSFYRDVNPQLPHPLWALMPLVLSFALARLAWWLTRHSYLILTPLGVEIFPFFHAARDMRMIAWSEISSAEVDKKNTHLTLHYSPEKTAGVHLTLAPICAARRELLVKAIYGRVPVCRVPGEVQD
jgi:hypothetical protein